MIPSTKKIIILILITVFLISVVNLYSQEPSPTPLILSQPQQNKTEPKHTKSNDQQRGSDELPLAVKIIKAKESNPKENDNAKNTKENATTNWLLVLFNGLLAIFTLGLYITSHKMWKSTKGAADAAKTSADSYKASEGAHLFIDYIKWKKREPNFTLSEYNKSVASINIVNVGRTPAILGDIGAAVNIKKIDYPTKEEAGRVNTINFPKGVIIKTLGIEPISCQECVGPSVISEDDFNQSIIICYGFVRYEDIFGNGHETGFCYEFKPRQTDDRFRISSNKELNYYT